MDSKVLSMSIEQGKNGYVVRGAFLVPDKTPNTGGNMPEREDQLLVFLDKKALLEAIDDIFKDVPPAGWAKL